MQAVTICYYIYDSQRSNLNLLTHTTGAKGSLADFCIHKGTCIKQFLTWFSTVYKGKSYTEIPKVNLYRFRNFNSSSWLEVWFLLTVTVMLFTLEIMNNCQQCFSSLMKKLIYMSAHAWNISSGQTSSPHHQELFFKPIKKWTVEPLLSGHPY